MVATTACESVAFSASKTEAAAEAGPIPVTITPSGMTLTAAAAAIHRHTRGLAGAVGDIEGYLPVRNDHPGERAVPAGGGGPAGLVDLALIRAYRCAC